MLKKLALHVLGSGLFVWSVAVLGVTVAMVASARADNPPCPACDQIRLTCDGSLCECKQTSMGSGVWECRDNWVGGD